MKLSYIVIALMLTGCSSFLPVTSKFPAVPEELLAKCNALILVKEDTTKLSEVLVVVTKNYSQYHECSSKIDAWNEWYTRQKKIHESIDE